MVLWSTQPRQIGTVNLPLSVTVCSLALDEGCVLLRTNLLLVARENRRCPRRRLASGARTAVCILVSAPPSATWCPRRRLPPLPRSYPPCDAAQPQCSWSAARAWPGTVTRRCTWRCCRCWRASSGRRCRATTATSWRSPSRSPWRPRRERAGVPGAVAECDGQPAGHCHGLAVCAGAGYNSVVVTEGKIDFIVAHGKLERAED